MMTEQIMEFVCDTICKYPAEYKDPDDLWNEQCDRCRLRELLAEDDVRPVVRGRWEWDVLDGTPGYRPVVLCCSNCHRVSFSGWDYCPNCGADMRVEQDE